MVAIDEPISGSTTADAPKPRAFASSELVPCSTCSRANPPTRASCLYCGAALEITELNAFSPAPDMEIEAPADGCIHVAIAPSQVEEATIEKLAGLLDRKLSDLQLLLAQPMGAPLLAVNSERQAQAAVEKLHEHGVATRVISDEQLAVQNTPVAVSALEIRDDAVVGMVGRSKPTVSFWDQIRLIVIGRLYFETKEIEQKRSRAQQVIDEREILTDEAVLDIYVRRDEVGWRIRANSFDFSCLGDKKQLTAFANFAALTALLRERATAAVLDDSYVRVRNALNTVWPAEPNARAKQRRRTAFGDFDSSVTSIDNELQFTRYSRLLSYLHEANSEGHAAQA